MKKTISSLIILSFALTIGFTQDLAFDNIQKIEFQEKGDYDSFENAILKYIDWLETQPLDHKDRMGVNVLIFKWVEGTSNVTVSLYPFVMDCVKKNPDFMTLYLAGWTKYALKNPDEDNNLNLSVAAINTILDYYEKGKTYGVRKDKRVEKLLKKRQNGKLDKYIARQIE